MDEQINGMVETIQQLEKVNAELKLRLDAVSGSANVDTVNGTKKKLNLWRKITKELALLDDNNYKARIIYEYVVKHYR